MWGKGIFEVALSSAGNFAEVCNAPGFMGPFRVLSHIGKLANHLTKSDSASIYLVFHVSLLQIVVGQMMLLILFPLKIDNNLMVLVNPIELLEILA